MSISVTRILGISLLGLVTSVGALQAQQQAEFHLPFTATWGTVVMSPGDYTVSVPTASIFSKQFLLSGQDTKAFILPSTSYVNTASDSSSDHGYLTLVNVDGTYYVETYKSGTSGTEFSFHVPKAHIRVKMTKRDAVKLDVAGE